MAQKIENIDELKVLCSDEQFHDCYIAIAGIIRSSKSIFMNENETFSVINEIDNSKDLFTIYQVPKEISDLLKTSCYDCHSNNTSYPWYNKVQPVAWILENHIEEGKAELNFSEWENYSERRKKSKLKSIVSQIEDGKMPLSSYTLLHGDAKLSFKQKEEIIKWIDK